MITRSWQQLRHSKPAPVLLARLADLGDPLTAMMLHDAAGPASVVDAAFKLVQFNVALSQMLAGVVLLKHGAPVAPLFHHTSRGAVTNEIGRVLNGRAPEGRGFIATLVGDNRQEIRVAVHPIDEGGGIISGAVLRLTDLTPQRQLEAQLAHSQKLQATGQLAGGIAHDFNNLLTAILGAAECIAEREPAGETAEDTRVIQGSAQRGAALVRQLLAFGRQQTLQPRALAMNDVIEGISSLLHRLIGSQVRLVLDLEQPGRKVRADPTQLDQVLVNLAVNARDAMPNGGELTLRSGHITTLRTIIHGAEAVPPGRYVTIDVQDTGGGIPPDVLPRIFDPFFTTKREAGGSGLGLSTVHGIVRQSDGFLGVESTLGRGTCMRIYLPRWDEGEGVETPKALAAIPTPAPARAVSGGLVLLVDDEDAVRKLAGRALQRAGWEVLMADSGESALELLENRPCDAPALTALISDMVMPGIDGTALAQRVRMEHATQDLPVILASGYAEKPLHGAVQKHATVFLAKPYTLAELVAALRKVTDLAM